MEEMLNDRLDEGLLGGFRPNDDGGVNDSTILKMINKEGASLPSMKNAPKLQFREAAGQVGSSPVQETRKGRKGYMVFLTEEQIQKVVVDSLKSAGIRDIDKNAINKRIKDDPQEVIDDVAAINKYSGKRESTFREYDVPGLDTEPLAHGEQWDDDKLESEEERLHADLDMDGEVGEDDAHYDKVYQDRNPRDSGVNGRGQVKGQKRTMDFDQAPSSPTKKEESIRISQFKKVYESFGESLFTGKELKAIYEIAKSTYDADTDWEDHCENELSQLM